MSPLRKGSQKMLSVLKTKTLKSNEIGLPKTFRKNNLFEMFTSLLQFWYFVSPKFPIPRSEIFFKEQ